MGQQTYSSAATSINSTKLPAVYSRVLPIAKGKTIIDYGCGRYPDIIRQAAQDVGASWYGYDRYNYQGDTLPASADIVVCANVLNVIDSDAAVMDVLQAIAGYMRGNSVAYIAIYEGDKSGIGKPTKADCYQRNARAKAYVDMCKRVFGDVTPKDNVLICGL